MITKNAKEEKLMVTLSKEEKERLFMHHEASQIGYTCKENIGKYHPYKGKFGEGYIQCLGRNKNSRTYENIIYWIKK